MNPESEHSDACGFCSTVNEPVKTLRYPGRVMAIYACRRCRTVWRSWIESKPDTERAVQLGDPPMRLPVPPESP